MIERVSWPIAELDRGVVELAGMLGATGSTPSKPSTDEALEPWLNRAVDRLGLELEPVSMPAGELAVLLRKIGPAVIRVPGDAPRVLLILASGRRCKLLGPDGRVVRISSRLLAERLLAERLLAEEAEVAPLFARLGLDPGPDGALARSFARERIATAAIDGLWLLRPPPTAAARVLARRAHAPALLTILLGARVAATASFIGLFWLIGRDVFGVVEASPLLLGLFAASFVVLRLVDAWAQSRLTLDVGLLLKEALLCGILRLDRGAVQGRGVGQFLSMAMAGEGSTSAGEGALMLAMSGVELLAALVILGLGVAGPAFALLLVAWLGLTTWLCRRYLDQAVASAAHERAVTHDLIERLIGYQTRLVQERPEDRHLDEDRLVRDHLESARELDRRRLPLGAPISIGWTLVGLALLEPTLTSGSAPAATAIAIGGVLLAANALRELGNGVVFLGELVVAWRETAPLLAAGRADTIVEPERDGLLEPVASLRFADLTVRYPARASPALRECSQSVARGERILLEGPSGGGKSTLALVLAGLRSPDAGTIELRDADGDPIPEALRGERVVLIPQFHDNHILTASLAFNLLLGRGSPPGPEDLADARAICEQLGLGALIERMPQGPSQPIGDGGWVLSHGERSRVCLARALLQDGVELLILDESFAALDPDTLVHVGRGLFASAPTLLVIAHS